MFSFPDRTANFILSHPKPLQWLSVERKVHFTEATPSCSSLLRAQTFFLPFRVPHSCLSLWCYVRCCLSCWIMKLSLGWCWPRVMRSFCFDLYPPVQAMAGPVAGRTLMQQIFRLCLDSCCLTESASDVWVWTHGSVQCLCLLPMQSSMSLLTRVMIVIGIHWRNLWSMWLLPQNKTIENK